MRQFVVECIICRVRVKTEDTNNEAEKIEKDCAPSEVRIMPNLGVGYVYIKYFKLTRLGSI